MVQLPPERIRILKKARTPGAPPLLFAPVHNEVDLLPHFFSHYRKLGVTWFVIFDDRSTDGTLEFLKAQPDCTVFGSHLRFGDPVRVQDVELRFGHYLRLFIPVRLAPTGWALVVDADEFMILPPGFETLQELIAHLESVGQSCLTAPMVDFYPRTLSQRNAGWGDSPFSSAPYFDVGPYYDWRDSRVPKHFFRGVRARLRRLLRHAQPELSAQIFGKTAVHLACWKVPLIRNGMGIQRALTAHEVNVAPPLGVSAALAHFKFGPDLDDRIAHALRSGAYFRGSLEYRFLEAVVRHLGEHDLVAAETRTFTGAQSLVDAGLLTPPAVAGHGG